MSWKRYFVKACVINADYEECEKRVQDKKKTSFAGKEIISQRW